MTLQQQNILTVGLKADDATRLVGLLPATDFTIEAVAEATAALKLIAANRYAVVIAAYPIVGTTISGFVTAMRARTCRSVNAGLALLTPAAQGNDARAFIGRGVNKVITDAESDQTLLNVVKILANPRNPLAKRHASKLQLHASVNGVEHRWVAENISAGGFLARAESPPAIGSRFQFILVGPQQKIRGEAKVVRLTDASRESVRGFGARFCTFEGNGRKALAELLRSLQS